MTDPLTQTPPQASQTEQVPSPPSEWEVPATPLAEPVSAAELAAQLSARLCHDFVSPASAIVSGLDLLEDPTAADMRDDAMNLISASARKLVDMLAFARVAFGSSASAETFDTRELEKLAQGVFAHVRPQMEWAVTEQGLNKTAARALLNLAQIGAGALPTGGLARISAVVQDGDALLSVEASGPRARLRPEVTSGLRGEKLEGGLGGHWVQAYYLHLLLKMAGGRVDFALAEERVTLRARVSAA
ncbi:MAG: histidine phosphotransferase family protein [Caulobacteraceae bacterium]